MADQNAQHGMAQQNLPQRKVVTRFALIAIGGFIVLMLAWVKLSHWLSYPVAVLSHTVLEQSTPMWIRSVEKQPGKIAVDTSVEIVVPNSGGRRAEVLLEANPGRYAFGLPILGALLFAAWAVRRAPGRLWRMGLGYVLLLPFQSFSLVMYLLMELASASQFSIRTLRIEQWQLEAIVYGYQFGVLVVPTLVPVLVWLLLDGKFFSALAHDWKQSTRRAVLPSAKIE